MLKEFFENRAIIGDRGPGEDAGNHEISQTEPLSEAERLSYVSDQLGVPVKHRIVEDLDFERPPGIPIQYFKRMGFVPLYANNGELTIALNDPLNFHPVDEMARQLADRVEQHPRLELLQQPTLSICCFRYKDDACTDLNKLNRDIHRHLLLNNQNLPSTATINGKLALRPCFVGARTSQQQVNDLLEEVVALGDRLRKDHMAA